MSPKQYLEQARRGVIGGPVNATGRAGQRKIGFVNAVGNATNPVLQSAPRWNKASGSAVQTVSQLPGSQPYVIQVSNASAGAVSNFNIWGAYQYLSHSASTPWYFDVSGNLVYGSITVSSQFSTTSYYSMLSSLYANPIVVGESNIYVASGSPAQAQQAITLILQQPTGGQSSQIIIYKFSDNQFQSVQTTNTTQFQITDRIAYQIPSILGNSVVLFYFYPSMDVALSNALTNTPVQGNYSNPQNNLQTVKLI